MSGFWAARGKDGHYEILFPASEEVRGVCEWSTEGGVLFDI